MLNSWERDQDRGAAFGGRAAARCSFILICTFDQRDTVFDKNKQQTSSVIDDFIMPGDNGSVSREPAGGGTFIQTLTVLELAYRGSDAARSVAAEWTVRSRNTFAEEPCSQRSTVRQYSDPEALVETRHLFLITYHNSDGIWKYRRVVRIPTPSARSPQQNHP